MVPVTLITGPLGSGKTTLIRRLASAKPAHEIWAVLVNEFGDVGLDGAVLGADGQLAVRELAGGCLCCTLGAPLKVAVIDLIRKLRPARLIIEPTGLGHPAGILESLTHPDMAQAIRLDAVVGLADVREAGQRHDDLFRDQMDAADIVIGTKADRAEEADLSRFAQWAAALFPAKQKVLITGLDLPLPLGDILTHRQNLSRPLLGRPLDHSPDTTGARHADDHDHDHPGGHRHRSDDTSHAAASGMDKAGDGLRMVTSDGLGHAGTGFILPAGWLFDGDGLLDLLGAPHLVAPAAALARLKGVFRTNRGWLAVDRVRNEVTWRETAYRADQRLELLVSAGGQFDAASFRAKLLALKIRAPQMASAR